MIRDFVHLIKINCATMPFFSLCTVSPARRIPDRLFLLGVLCLCPRVHFSRPSVCNNTGICLCKRHIYAYLPCRNRPEKSRADLQLYLQCTRPEPAFGNSERKKCACHLFRFRRLAKTIRSCSVRFTTPDTISAVCGQRRHPFPSGNRPSHWKISHSELIALPILKRRCFVLKTETMTTLLSGSSRNPAVTRCSGTSIPWTGKTMGHRTSSIGF